MSMEVEVIVVALKLLGVSFWEVEVLEAEDMAGHIRRWGGFSLRGTRLEFGEGATVGQLGAVQCCQPRLQAVP